MLDQLLMFKSSPFSTCAVLGTSQHDVAQATQVFCSKDPLEDRVYVTAPPS